MAEKNQDCRLYARVAPKTRETIDELVEDGHYKNRTDFISKAIEDRLKLHEPPAGKAAGE